MFNFTWNNVKFAITDIGGGVLHGEIPRHAHSNESYELHYITDGLGTLITDSKKLQLKKGSFFLTGPSVYHSQISNPENPMEDVFFMLQAKDTKNKNSISAAFLDTDFWYCDSLNNSLAKMLLEEYRNKLPDYEIAISSLTKKLLIDITRMLLPKNYSPVLDTNNLNDKRFIIIEHAFLYEPRITLSQLSSKIGLCERQTQRLLKKYYGKSFREKKKEQKNML